MLVRLSSSANSCKKLESYGFKKVMFSFCVAMAMGFNIQTVEARQTMTELSLTHELLKKNVIQISSLKVEQKFSIEAQDLAQALVQFGKQSGVQVSFKKSVTEGKKSGKLVGSYSVNQALSQLLSGSGLEASFVGQQSVFVGPNVQVAQAGDAVQLDGIVVYGEKLERDYLNTYTSVGIVTNEDLEDYTIKDSNELFNRLANVRNLDNNGGNDILSIRGLNGDGLAGEVSNSVPVVSVILDGALQNSEGSRRGTRSTWDMKQIEVLRGPQSSLYGRAALAGAVVYESNDPSYNWQVGLKGDYGSFEHKTGAFFISGPIIDNQVAFRISMEGHESENDITYLDSDNEILGKDKFHNIRGKILVEPKAIKGLRALFTFNHAFDRPSVDRVDGPDYFARTETLAADFGELREINVDNYIANVSYAYNDALTLRSITSFTYTDLDIENTPNSIVFDRADVRDGEDFTQDIRVEIDDKKGSGLSGVIGGFYGKFKQDINQNWQVDGAYAGCAQQDLDMDGQPDKTPAQCVSETAFLVDNGFYDPFSVSFDVNVGNQGYNIDTTALYADLRYNIWGPLSLIGGLRYQKDEVNNFAEANGILTGFTPTSYSFDAEFEVWLPKYGLAYEIDKNQTIAATASRGYRQGFTELNAVIGQNDVDPEFVWTYELAYRYVTSDKRLSFGANLFYNDYKDQQFATFDPVILTAATFNAGESRSYGLELDGRYDFGNGLKVFGSLGLLKTEILDLKDPRTASEGGVCVQSGGNCKGNDFAEAPEVTFAFGGIYRHHTGLFAAADVSYTSSFFSGGHLDNNPSFEVDSHFIANAKVGYEAKGVKASLYVKNLFDEEYLTSINPDTVSANVGDGRSIGAEVLMKF